MRGLRKRRRPKVGKLASRHDLRRLLRALEYRDVIVDSRDRLYDLGAPIRRDAAHALAHETEGDGDRIRDALSHALADPRAEVGIAAARSLAQRGDTEAVPALVHAAWITDDPGVRAAASDAIVALATPEALTMIVQRSIADPPGPEQAPAMIAEIVDRIGHEAAQAATEPAVAELRRGDADDRSRAAEVLVWMGSASLDALLELVTRVPRSRVEALYALGELRDLRAADLIAQQLHDDDAEVRRAAVQALGRLDEPSSSHAITMLTRDPDPGVRAAALHELRRLGPMSVPLDGDVPGATAYEDSLSPAVKRRRGSRR